MKTVFKTFALAALVMLGACKQSTIPQPTKIADYLFEISVDDYAPEAPSNLLGEALSDFGCSAVRNGNYYGRNLDFFVSEISEFIVRTSAKDGRHASIGVARLNHMTDTEVEAGLSEEALAILPWGMFDGINDAGLFCNMNVTPAADAGIPHTSPDPSKPELSCVFLVRALLDNCGTVDDAVEFVNSHNITGMNAGGWDLHFMIGDPNKNVVLEFIDNKAVIKEQYIMTNFFVNLLPEYTPHADGIERYDILKEHYAEGGESMQGMWDLMKRVQFSQAYDPATEPFWKSEFYEGTAYTIESSLDEILADESIQKSLADFKHYKETGEYTPEMGLWYTTHTSVYDIANKTLWVTVHEDYAQRYEFSL